MLTLCTILTIPRKAAIFSRKDVDTMQLLQPNFPVPRDAFSEIRERQCYRP